MAAAGERLEKRGLVDWTIGTVPETFEGRSGGHTVQGFPALVDGAPRSPSRSSRIPVRRRPPTAAGCDDCSSLNTSPPWKRVLARLTNTQKVVPPPAHTAASRPSSRTAWPRPSTPSSPSTCPVRSAPRVVCRGAGRRAHPHRHAVLTVVDGVIPVLEAATRVRHLLEATGRDCRRRPRTFVPNPGVVRRASSPTRAGPTAPPHPLPARRRRSAWSGPRGTRARRNCRPPSTASDGIRRPAGHPARAAPTLQAVLDLAWLIEAARVLFAQGSAPRRRSPTSASSPRSPPNAPEQESPRRRRRWAGQFPPERLDPCRTPLRSITSETDGTGAVHQPGVLLVLLGAFIDAGNIQRTLGSHLLETGEPQIVVSFDVDQPSITADVAR